MIYISFLVKYGNKLYTINCSFTFSLKVLLNPSEELGRISLYLVYTYHERKKIPYLILPFFYISNKRDYCKSAMTFCGDSTQHNFIIPYFFVIARDICWWFKVIFRFMLDCWYYIDYPIHLLWNIRSKVYWGVREPLLWFIRNFLVNQLDLSFLQQISCIFHFYLTFIKYHTMAIDYVFLICGNTFVNCYKFPRLYFGFDSWLLLNSLFQKTVLINR